MARIRSVHPGTFTDEVVMRLTVENPLAVLLWQGLWTESDDQGVFEWKPFTIKARILPAPNIDINEMLAMLVEVNMIREFEANGKRYGAIRNFRQYQRPERPKTQHPLPDNLRKYVSLETSITDSPPAEQPSIGAATPNLSADGEERREEKGNGTLREHAGKPRARAQEDCEISVAVDDWNSLARELSLARVQKLTEDRKRKLRARLRDCGGVVGWRAALDRIRGSPFCQGEGPRGWAADFDFLLQEASFVRLMEGRYDAGKVSAAANTIANGFAQVDAVIAELRRRECGTVAEGAGDGGEDPRMLPRVWQGSG